jgi:hypothetical protein
MGERPLTGKQQRFAELVAGGASKSDAFRRAYPSDLRGKATVWAGAQKVAAVPKVAAEVQRLRLLRSPHDAAAQAEHIAARLLELTKSPEPEVALRAISQWAKLREAGLLRPAAIDQPTINGRQPSADERRQILDELKALYQKAVPTPQNGAEPLDPSCTDPAKKHCLVIDMEPTDGAATATALGKAFDGASDPRVSGATSLDRSEPMEKFALRPVPGFFPPRLMRVYNPPKQS